MGWCWWGVIGLEFAYEGTTLMFRVALDLRGIACKGFRPLSLSFSQLPSGVTNLNVVGLFSNCTLGCLLPHYGPNVLGRRVETGLIATHPKPACAQTKAPLLELW